MACDSVVEGGNSVQLIDTGVDIVENVHNVKCSWTSQGVNANVNANVGGTVQQRWTNDLLQNTMDIQNWQDIDPKFEAKGGHEVLLRAGNLTQTDFMVCTY